MIDFIHTASDALHCIKYFPSFNLEYHYWFSVTDIEEVYLHVALPILSEYNVMPWISLIDRRHLQQWISPLHIFQILLIIRLCLHIKNIPEILRIRQIINQVLIDLRLILNRTHWLFQHFLQIALVPSLCNWFIMPYCMEKQGILPNQSRNQHQNRQFFTKFQIFKSMDQLPCICFSSAAIPLSCMLPVYLRKTLWNFCRSMSYWKSYFFRNLGDLHIRCL